MILGMFNVHRKCNFQSWNYWKLFCINVNTICQTSVKCCCIWFAGLVWYGEHVIETPKVVNISTLFINHSCLKDDDIICTFLEQLYALYLTFPRPPAVAHSPRQNTRSQNTPQRRRWPLTPDLIAEL